VATNNGNQLPVAITPEQVEEAAARWGLPLSSPEAQRLATYGNLLQQWNSSLSLTAIRDEAELVDRHLMEGVFAAAHHPEASTALDFGSGTGIPGIPIAICREHLAVTLAESKRRKAAFLQEAFRQLHVKATIHASRAETLPPGSFDAVWMRAVDKSALMLPMAAALVAPGGSLCLLGTDLAPSVDPVDSWQWKSILLPRSNDRVLHIGTRK
jgi:16S rRNA (guanine527-N7)-methyltransferase